MIPASVDSTCADVPLDHVAASLLGLGTDTRAARVFATLGPGAGVVELAHALQLPASERAGEIALARRRAAAVIERGRTLGLGIVPFGYPSYPEWLSQVPDPPVVLWTCGDASLLNKPGVAVVGSRRASVTGVSVAERLARDLSRAGLVITSGLATGIDGAAHRGALAAGGRTVAVLGSGPDVIYPGRHTALAAEVAAHGCLVSEFPPGTPPRTHHFPLRNRIISGLSRAVVVVEAAERSGSLITARMALEQGRSVAAVPGSVVSGCHKGCHALIKDGARLVEIVDDVLEEIGWQRAAPKPAEADKLLFGSGLLDKMADGTPVTVDGLARETALGGPEVLAELTELELAGRVRRLPGGWFVRLD